MKTTNLKLGQILIHTGVLTEEQLQKALAEQKGSHKRLGEILIEKNFVTEKQVIASLVQQLDIPYQDLSGIRIDRSVSSLIPETMARINTLVPIKREGDVLTIAVNDPLNYNAINNIAIYTRLKINPVISEKEKIEQKIREAYTTQKAFEAAEELTTNPIGVADAAEIEEDSSQPIVDVYKRQC